MWNQYSEKSPEVSQDVTVRLDINSRVKKLIHEYFILSFNLKKEPNVKEFMDYLTDNVPDIAENITTKTLVKLFDEERNSIESFDETTPRIQDQESIDIANDTKSSDMNLSDDFENLGFEKRVEKTKLIQLFEYLKAYRSKLEEPIRNISKYDDIVVWYNDIPIGEGCFLSKGDESKDYWLIIKKQEVPKPPQPPEEIKDWISEGWSDPFKEPKVKEVVYIEDSTENYGKEIKEKKVINFDDDIKRVKIWNKWLNEKWIPWSLNAQPKEKVKKLYNKLFLLSQRLEREEEDIEMVWGHGMLYWNFRGYQIKHPIFTTKVHIDFDDKYGIIKISPGIMPTEVETNFLQGIEARYVKILMKIQEKISDNPVNPWDEEECISYFNSIVNQLSPDGKVIFDGNNISATIYPIITYEPVIFVRRKKIGYMNDIETILEGLKQGKLASPPIRKIIDYSINFDIEHKDEWSMSPDDVLLPLPSNNEQLQIIERLANNVGVTVQGPPGTGKSHTIANLISHLLAHGKRVLVTAKAERPLKVLREKIPEGIKPLCVSLLTDDSGSLFELEQAVNAITENVVSLDKAATEQIVADLKEKLKETRGEIAELRQRIKDISKREFFTYTLLGEEYSLKELGRWLSENEKELSYIPDNLDLNDELPLTEQELKRLFELAGIISHEDRALLRYKLPDVAKLPSGNYMSKLVDNINYFEKKVNADFVNLWERASNISAKEVKDILDKCVIAEKEAEEFLGNQWLGLIFEDVGKGGYLCENWVNFYDRITREIEQLIKLKQYTSRYEIILPKDYTLAELKENIKELREYFEKGKRITFLTGLLYPKFKKLINTCRINGALIKNKEDTSILLSEIEQQIIKNNIIIEWKKVILAIGGPDVDPDNPRFEVLVDDCMRLIKNIIDWHQDKWKFLYSKILQLGLTLDENSTLKAIKVAINQLTDMLNVLYLEESKEKYNAVKRYLKDEVSNPQVSLLWSGLYQAFEDENWQKWDEIINKIKELKNIEKLEREFEELKNRLESTAPQWVENILKEGGKGVALSLPPNVKEAWEWRKAETWLKRLLSEDTDSLTKRVDELKAQESKIVIDLVKYSTWLNLANNVTEEQRRSLIAWQQQVKRIGKGTGKYALRRKQIAQKEMQKARNAVPVWIMPLNKIIENFKPWDELFDVIIVDESSQIDIFGILAIFRAKKVLIVGDDKQISPQGVGIDLKVVHELIDGYLDGLPHKELYEPQYSLYDLAKQVFPGAIVLKEHFRCLPEIIQFSNDLMYQGEILPLREREPWMGDDWQPVVAIKVKDGYREPGRKINIPEAQALVEKIEYCCNNPQYKDMTMGVISLLGKEQADLIEEMLLERLGPEELRKRKIRCGDAYYFQGDERDVMFLSLVEAKGEQRIATLNKEDDRRRFNVATSRAKNQMFLFYSIDPDEFNTPEDVRAQLIRYCMNPRRFVEQYNNLEDACESEFERRVLRDLLNLGYLVKPQYRVGHKRIDFVVFGIKERLAVECDGDAYHGPDRWEDDWNRQLLLERLGWKFFRIRGSQYFRDREGTIKKLVERLTELEIEPLK